MVGITVLYTLVPYLLRELTNALSIAGTSQYSALAVMLAIAYGLTWTAANAGEWLKNLLSAALLARCDAAFQQAVYGRLIRVAYPHVVETDPGTLVSVVARGRDAFSQITFTLFWIIAPAALQLLLSGIVLWRATNGEFAVAFVAVMLGLFAVTWQIAKQSKHAHTDIFSASDLLSSHLVEKLNFLLDIKLNRAYAREDAALHKVLDSFVGKVSGGHARLSLLLGAQAMCTGLVLTAFTIAVTMEVMRHTFQVGDFVMIVGYIVALTAPFTSLAACLSDLRRNHIALRDGFALLELPLERESTNTFFDHAARDVYRLDQVDVVVDRRTILRNVNMRIGRQELVVLMGPSGAGKSSLANLMLGLSEPGRGTVQLYEANLRDIAVADVSREVAVAPQSPLILTGTLRDNLVYGCERPPPDSELLELVDLLELGSLGRDKGADVLDQPLGIQGRALSGGERQRIALGRALARRPSVVIFDEPTSSLDAEREARIFAHIRRRVPTLIVITHHQSLLKFADRAYQVERDTVREFFPPRPSGTISEDCSATEMNSPGDTMPRCG